MRITFVCYHLLREVIPAKNPAKALRVSFIYGIVVKRFCSKEPTAGKKKIVWSPEWWVSSGHLSSGTWETLRWNLQHKAQLKGFQGLFNHRGYWLVSLRLCCLWQFREALHMSRRPDLSQGQRSGFGPPLFMGLQVMVETHRA